jgi:hypothetical protein
MKKIIAILMFAILAGAITSCSSPVPQDSFRVQTRKKFNIFGIPLPFSVKLPFVSINLKTNTMPGTPGTIGNRTEFDPGGQYVNTGANANFDAVGAVLPAPWTVKAAPNQPHCASSNPTTYSAVAGQKYNFRCNLNIIINFLVEPSIVNLMEQGSTPPESLEGNTEKGSHLFASSQNLVVQYYKRQGNTEDYELVDEKPVLEIVNNGRGFRFDMPYNEQSYGIAHFRVLVIDEAERDIYLAHGEFQIYYPLYVDPPIPGDY